MIADRRNTGDALENEFVFGHRYPERVAVYETIARMSESARTTLDGRRYVLFGPDGREQMNLFPRGADAPLIVFIHGGYWRSQDRRNYDFVASPLNALGFSVVVPGYPLAPDATMGRIVQSLRTALMWLSKHGPKHGVSTRDLYLCGHSAGGHLAALLASDSAGETGLPPVRGCLPISGIFDLRPLLATSVNQDVHLDVASAERFSPALRRTGVGWMLATFGANETEVFKSQAADYARRWAGTGAPADCLPIADRNHYNILLDLVSGQSAIAAALYKRVVADRAGISRRKQEKDGETALC